MKVFTRSSKQERVSEIPELSKREGQHFKPE